MPTSRPPLSYDVFVAPEKPFTIPPSRFGDPPAWGAAAGRPGRSWRGGARHCRGAPEWAPVAQR